MYCAPPGIGNFLLRSCPVLFLVLPCPFLPSQSLPPSFLPFSCWMPVEKEEGGERKVFHPLFSFSLKDPFLPYPPPLLLLPSVSSVRRSVCLSAPSLATPFVSPPPPRVEQLSDPRARADRWTFPTKTEKKESSPPRLTLLCT